MKFLEQVKQYITITPDCHLWTGPVRAGDGTPYVPREQKSVYKALYREWTGRAFPKTKYIVGTKCGNRKCVNPEHFTLRDGILLEEFTDIPSRWNF